MERQRFLHGDDFYIGWQPGEIDAGFRHAVEIEKFAGLFPPVVEKDAHIRPDQREKIGVGFFDDQLRAVPEKEIVDALFHQRTVQQAFMVEHIAHANFRIQRIADDDLRVDGDSDLMVDGMLMHFFHRQHRRLPVRVELAAPDHPGFATL